MTSPSIVVKIDNLYLAGDGDPNSDTSGIRVEGPDDTNLKDYNLALNYVVITGFTGTGLVNNCGRVLIQNTNIFLNSSGFLGGGVDNFDGNNNDGSVCSPTFVAKYSTISDNTAYEGGGIFNSGTLDLRSTIVEYNSADAGGAIFNEVGSYDPPGCTCNVERDTRTAARSEIDNNIAYYPAPYGFSIVDSSASVINCSFHDTIGSGNSSPYCSSGTTNCPQ